MENKLETKRFFFNVVSPEIKGKKYFRSKTRYISALLLILFNLVFHLVSEAQTQAPLRRPISPSSPMWLIHIDSWNNADPQKIIDLIPSDIRPYVVMNIALSISHDVTTGTWNKVEYGYETAKSWLRTCAENQIWAMIQPASGGPCHFSETDLTVYREFYRDYPNFIGFNYCEQFWGFDDPNDVRSVSWTTRIAHFVDLINLADTNGGYLCVSWCGAYYTAGINPIAMLKRNPAFASVLQTKSDHFILCEKYTSKYGFYDIESTCLGTYLSGYSGQYGIRFDQSGWSSGEDATGITTAAFPVPAGAAPVIEHIMLTGETVMDGPELIWQQCIQGLSNSTTADGYTTRRWGFYPQFNNISIDIFRKVLDGTIRIMTRKEVIDRTKLVIINDANSGSDTVKYSSPMALFDGLYKTDGSGQLLNNRTWFKKTGRYPSIPTVYALNGTDANSFSVKVNKSAYYTRWATTAAKVNEFDNLFPQEYTGTIYAGRNENGWVTYNPYKTATTATGHIPFKYNTCTSMDLSYSQYTVGVIKEYSDKVTYYLTNFDNVNTALQTDVITIDGCSSQPTFSYTDRASHSASTVTSSYSSGIFTLTIMHNGPLDITVNCSGSATDRLTSYTTATLSTPSTPAVYTGPCQYEAENFDYKNIAGNVTQGYNTGIASYTAMGYLQFGTSSAASIKKNVKVQNADTYFLATKYSTTGGDVNTIDLYVNGTKVATPTFTATSSTSTWGTNNQTVTLDAGSNTIEFRANATGVRTIYFDNIVLSVATPTITTSASSLSGFSYTEGSGPSTSQSFTVSGSLLPDNVVVTAPTNYEVSLNSTTGYVSSLTLAQSIGTLAQTTIYIRLTTGLAANTYNGNISITSTSALSKTVSLSGTVNPQPTVMVSVTTLSGISYVQGTGPSTSQSFTVSGSSLVDNILVNAPTNYEVSLNSTTGYASLVTLTPSNGAIAQTTIYVRLKSGLVVNSYSGDIFLASTGTLSKTVSLSGSVTQATNVKYLSGSSATIILKEYYTLTGQRVYNTTNLKGLYIVKNYMSDGTITTSKIWIE